MKVLGWIFLGVLLTAAGTTVVPSGATTMETIACNSGASPCATTTSAAILNPAANRAQCLLQNVDVGDYLCVQGATVALAGTASSTNMHFVLKAASAANKGDGGSYTCSQGPATFRGAIVCTCTGTCHITASAALAAGQ